MIGLQYELILGDFVELFVADLVNLIVLCFTHIFVIISILYGTL